MKKVFCIFAATVLLSLCLTGCGDRGRIGNGENGTVSDNSSSATEKITENNTDNNTNNTNNGENSSQSDAFNNNNNVENNTPNENNDEQTSDNSDQQGLAGEIGDAIDEGVSDLENDITGNETNTEG